MNHHRSKSIQIFTIGDELLRGEIVNTNASFLASRLHAHGLSILRVLTVGDDLDALVDVLKEGLALGNTIICSGGLGPTVDDRTSLAVSQAIGRPLVYNADAWENICSRFAC